MRNYGVLYQGPNGWRLSQAYDLKRVPTDIRPRLLAAAINEDDSTASVVLAIEVAGYFELNADTARDIAALVGNAWEAEFFEGDRVEVEIFLRTVIQRTSKPTTSWARHLLDQDARRDV